MATSYKIECWGAQGGSGISNKGCIGAKGGYTSGKLNLSKQVSLYIYVGQHPIYNYRDSLGQVFPKGYNGGGAGSSQIYNKQVKKFAQYGGSGGGATDIRLMSSNWDDFNSLKSRIMVAAGGAGGTYRSMYHTIVEAGAGAGGGLDGFDGADCDGSAGATELYKGTGGTQTYAGNCQSIDSIGGITVKESKLYQGGFGFGGNSSIEDQCGGTGGGGGYYGGGASDRGHVNGGGGSFFISGYLGCDAITESSIEDNIVHTGQPNHYSGKVFTNSIMIAGNATMPKPKGGTETGHEGNGYCIISWISPSL